MASLAITVPSKFPHLHYPKKNFNSCDDVLVSGKNTTNISICDMRHNLRTRLLFLHGIGHKCLCQPISSVGSGLKASFTDPEDPNLTLKDAKIVVESRDDDKIQVRVDLAGEETQKIYDKVLTGLARSAPPIPGFRREKGGKTSKVPKGFLLEAVGKDRVTKFVIQEIVSLTMNDYVKKENLTVKNKNFNTAQTAKELELKFVPGSEFGFNATLELDKAEAETTTSEPSEMSPTRKWRNKITG